MNLKILIRMIYIGLMMWQNNKKSKLSSILAVVSRSHFIIIIRTLKTSCYRFMQQSTKNFHFGIHQKYTYINISRYILNKLLLATYVALHTFVNNWSSNQTYIILKLEIESRNLILTNHPTTLRAWPAHDVWAKRKYK